MTMEGDLTQLLNAKGQGDQRALQDFNTACRCRTATRSAIVQVLGVGIRGYAVINLVWLCAGYWSP
jgi:hypothetical protein